VGAGRFRSDLFYRLNVIPIELSPLRERASDIPQLVMFFLGRFASKFGKKIDSVDGTTMDLLTEYAWPGNIRELQNLIERAVVLSKGSVLNLDPGFFPSAAGSRHAADATKPSVEDGTRKDRGPADGSPALVGTPTSTLEEIDRQHVLSTLDSCGGVIEGPKGAAKRLGLHPSTLRSRIAKLGINRKNDTSL